MNEGFYRRLRNLALARTGLKPCPCCEQPAIMVFENAYAGIPERHFAACTSCGLRTPVICSEQFDHVSAKWVAQDSAAIAQALWERRPNDQGTLVAPQVAAGYAGLGQPCLACGKIVEITYGQSGDAICSLECRTYYKEQTPNDDDAT